MVFNIPGAHALEPGDLLGLLVVRGPDQVAAERSGSGENPLELQGGDHIGQGVVMVGPALDGIKGLKPRGQDHGPDLDLFGFGLHGVVDGPGLAGGDALHALGADPAVEASVASRWACSSV